VSNDDPARFGPFINERSMAAMEAYSRRLAEISAMGAVAQDTPDSLRNGIANAFAEFQALAVLLVDKGIITENEMADSLAAVLEERLRQTRDYPSAN
jgi:hypothetical protein